MARSEVNALLRHVRRLGNVSNAVHVADNELLRRFAEQRDEAAFEMLVRRHGAMVLRVCRRVLPHVHDAEDVFQAAFLVLARKAAALRWQQSVGHWLYEVAYRLAQKARVEAARRSARSARVPERPAPDPLAEITGRELQTALDEELARLPVKYRAPLVLCCLEGISRDEAAQQLGCPLGTLKSRLERGRELLRGRLMRRGLALSAVLGAATLSPAASAALPVGLASTTARAALALIGRTSPVMGTISTQALNLANKGIRTMSFAKITGAIGMALAGLVFWGTVGITNQAPVTARHQGAATAAKPVSVADAPVQKAANEESNGPLVFSGKVLTADGIPAAGAKVYVTMPWRLVNRPPVAPVRATTGPDGRYRFTASRSEFHKDWWYWAVVAATAEGHGLGWVELNKDTAGQDQTLQLVKDDVPVNGRVLTLEGRPVAGANIRILSVFAAPKEDLTNFQEAIVSKKDGAHALERDLLAKQLAQPVPGLPERVSTDANGRFHLKGIGRDRVLAVMIEGPTIASTEARILTRQSPTIQIPESKMSPADGVMFYYGAQFDHHAAPTKPIVGVVRDRDTKKPLAGIKITSNKLAGNPTFYGRHFITTTTDAQGRYRLTGMPKGEGNKILAVPSDDHPYLVSGADVPDTKGLDPVAVDFDLKRGVWIKGRVNNNATGKPVPYGRVEYYALADNPHIKEADGFDQALFGDRSVNVAADGSYHLIGLPGPGIVAVVVSDHYLLANQTDDAQENQSQDTVPFSVQPISYNRFARIDPPAGTDSFACDVSVSPGLSFSGQVLDPSGRPLAGVRAHGLSGWGGWEHPPLPTADFQVLAYNPHRPRKILFLYPEKKLGGVLEIPANSTGPLIMKLEATGTVTARLVDADGQPRPNTEVRIIYRGKNDTSYAEHLPRQGHTDAAGRFRVENLLRGMIYRVDVAEVAKGQLTTTGWIRIDQAVRAGETVDLGDVQAKREE
ncbi:MAG TPA: sigma-70 family RNA polymerase sigma factor [Gemmataceae bacterium]|nr:sigma-70 family RNA polymerase sigma factor [Gemmataceae bacterium]